MTLAKSHLDHNLLIYCFRWKRNQFHRIDFIYQSTNEQDSMKKCSVEIELYDCEWICRFIFLMFTLMCYKTYYSVTVPIISCSVYVIPWLNRYVSLQYSTLKFTYLQWHVKSMFNTLHGSILSKIKILLQTIWIFFSSPIQTR